MITLASGMLDRVDFLVCEREILEQVFVPGWFQHAGTKEMQHPAYKRWKLCETLIAQGGTISIEQFSQLGRIALDTAYFVQLTEGNPEQLKLGQFELIGDEQVRKFIRSRIKDPNFYEDTMIQLYVASWHKAQHHSVALVEKEGWPDIRVNLEVPNIPMLVECKRLRSAAHTSASSQQTLQRQIERVIYKAGSQIKRAKREMGHSHCYGVVVLDVSSILPVRQIEIGTIPEEVVSIANMVQRVLSIDKNTSVHTAIVAWDMHRVDLTSKWNVRYVYSRRNIRIKHMMPSEIFPDDMPPYLVQTFYSSIDNYLLTDSDFQLEAARSRPL